MQGEDYDLGRDDQGRDRQLKRELVLLDKFGEFIIPKVEKGYCFRIFSVLELDTLAGSLVGCVFESCLE